MRLSPPAFWGVDGKTARALAPLGRAYASVAARRLQATPYQASVPVVCVGNVTLGGVGKTPFAMMLARFAAEAGHAPGFLTRGYGGTERGPHRVAASDRAGRVGDEALLLARQAPVWVSRDRAEGARAAVRAGAGLLVMDDGFQNPGLAKDLSFLLVEAEAGFGNGRVFPAGPLREEPAAAFARADAVVLIGEGRPAVADRVRRMAGALPVMTASLRIEAPPALIGGEVHALAGIGRPERFFAALAAAGMRVARSLPRPDHHPFARGEVETLSRAAEAAGAALVTTEKDWVRMNDADRALALPVPARMTTPDEGAIRAMLDQAANACQKRAA